MLSIDPQHTAILIMDYQNDIVQMTNAEPGLLHRASRVLTAARAAQVPVIYVVIHFRPGYPEIPSTSFFTMVRDRGMLQEGTAGAAIHEKVAPQPNDVIVTKKRVGAATGSDLECILRAGRRTHLVLFGISTSGVVLSTTRWAADADYTLNIVSDCCFDPDPEVHRVLIEKVLARMAPAVTSDELIDALGKARS